MISITYMHNYIIKRINNSIKCCLYLSLSSSERTKSMILISAWYFNHIMTLISFNQIGTFENDRVYRSDWQLRCTHRRRKFQLHHSS